MSINHKIPRAAAFIAVSGLAALISGCVVSPIGYAGYDGNPSASVYVAPPPVVVSPGYYGYRGYGGYGGYGHRGYRGHGGYWR